MSISELNRPGLPSSLPEKPTGWTRQMTMRMSLQGGGIGVFDVFDADGNKTPIVYSYDTSEKTKGFSLPHVDGLMSWEELRAKWPEWLQSRGRAEIAEADGKEAQG